MTASTAAAVAATAMVTVTAGKEVHDPGKKLPVMEVFGPTIAGEGAIAGQVTYFLRLGACSYRCLWCDQMESVDPDSIHKHATWLTQSDIFDRIEKFTKHAIKDTWLTISGGDPLSHNLTLLCMQLQTNEWLRIAIETQGAFYKEWLKFCDLITVSPKPPSSGMSERTNFDTLKQYTTELQGRMIFKIVIFDADDAAYAEGIHFRFPQVPLHLSAGTPRGSCDPRDVLKSYRNLAKLILKRPKLQKAVILPQLHVLLQVQ